MFIDLLRHNPLIDAVKETLMSWKEVIHVKFTVFVELFEDRNAQI